MRRARSVRKRQLACPMKSVQISNAMEVKAGGWERFFGTIGIVDLGTSRPEAVYPGSLGLILIH